MTFFGSSLRLLVGEVGHREQVVVDERVIARELLDAARRARGSSASRRRGRCTCGLLRGLNMAPTTVVPMPWYSRERVDALEDLAVGDADAREQAVLFFATSSCRSGTARSRRRWPSTRKNSRMVSVASLRRDVARAVAAHAVGDDEEVVLLEHDEGVFVVLALEPDVAQTRLRLPASRRESSNQKRVSPTPEGVKRRQPCTDMRLVREQVRSRPRGCPFLCWR